MRNLNAVTVYTCDQSMKSYHIHRCVFVCRNSVRMR